MIKSLVLVLIFTTLFSIPSYANEKEEDTINKKIQSVWQRDCKSCHGDGRSLAPKAKNKTIMDLSDFIGLGDKTHSFAKTLSDEEIEALAVFIMIHHHLSKLESIERNLYIEQQNLRADLERINQEQTKKR